MSQGAKCQEQSRVMHNEMHFWNKCFWCNILQQCMMMCLIIISKYGNHSGLMTGANTTSQISLAKVYSCQTLSLSSTTFPVSKGNNRNKHHFSTAFPLTALSFVTKSSGNGPNLSHLSEMPNSKFTILQFNVFRLIWTRRV